MKPSHARPAHKIRALDTTYNRVRFRSRLEARWAVYFDALGIAWQYEPQGYELADGSCYLPDFFLSQVRMFAEVKPGAFTAPEETKCRLLAVGTGNAVLMLDGPQAARPYKFVERDPVGCDPCDCFVDNQYLDEGRFFSCTGWIPGDEWGVSPEAVSAALSARF